MTAETDTQEIIRTDGRKGWVSSHLRVVGDDPQLWSVAEAAEILGPPQLSATQLRNLVRCAGLEPQGKRRTTIIGSGRHSRVYLASDLIRLYESIYALGGNG